ncbi:glucose transporter type 1-like [Mizuhopecten yessoensis]|uniref:Solute carrier family 2, facilitated glucose transporter member 1 n=1 Tax=Mizuhopecten yessoensis TaxID=6573 RepID=A0A210PTG0_MIZYE|nr:glucose transporter type 1-like [Mizuhopecten yessoensis]XP_021375595.1 glucose transporter type 1-like [Mizuhopecten yessoensis]OWF39797.1 Solute carrier family 2, facilitated glucose transporter member 1 [Mizuhopecten yessoensis]
MEREARYQETNIGISKENGDQNLNQDSAQPARGRITGRLVLSVFAAVMGSLQFGYNTGVINAPEGRIKEFMNQTNIRRTGESLTSGSILNTYALLVAIFAVGGMVGGLLAGWWADYFGRKHGMLINNAFGIGAAALMFFSRMAWSYEMVIVGRFLVGFNCGLYTGLTPLYLSEISTANIRGALGVLHQLGVTIGILLSQILGFPELLGNDPNWHILLGLCAVPCALQLLTMPFCPESPRYLLISKEQEEHALKALVKLRGTSAVQGDIEEMKKEFLMQQSEAKISLIHFLKKRSLWAPLLISFIMHLSQQLSGINAVFYYSSSLFKNVGLSDETAAHATSGIGGIMVIMTMVTIPLMDRVGRRTLHLLGLGGMFVFSILITVSLALTHLAEWIRLANVVVSLLYVVFFAIGPGSIPWLIVAELFSQGPRPAAMSLSVLVNWVANFGVGYAFPSMQEGLGNYSFLPFTVCIALCGIVLFIYLPETKNRTFEDITSAWRKRPDSELSLSSAGSNEVAKEDSNLVNFSGVKSHI